MKHLIYRNDDFIKNNYHFWIIIELYQQKIIIQHLRADLCFTDRICEKELGIWTIAINKFIIIFFKFTKTFCLRRKTVNLTHNL